MLISFVLAAFYLSYSIKRYVPECSPQKESIYWSEKYCGGRPERFYFQRARALAPDEEEFPWPRFIPPKDVYYNTFEEAERNLQEGETVHEFQVVDAPLTVFMNKKGNSSEARTIHLNKYKALMNEYIQHPENSFSLFQQMNRLQHHENPRDPFLCVLDKEKKFAAELNFLVNERHYKNKIYNPFLDNLKMDCQNNGNFLSLEHWMSLLLIHYYSHAIIGDDFHTLSSQKSFKQGFLTAQLLYYFFKINPDLDKAYFIESGPGNGDHMVELLAFLESNDDDIWNPEIIQKIKKNVVFVMNDMGDGPLKELQKSNTKKFGTLGFKIDHNRPLDQIREMIQREKTEQKKIGVIGYNYEVEDAMPHRFYRKTSEGWNQLGICFSEETGQFELAEKPIDYAPTDRPISTGNIFQDSPVGRNFITDLMRTIQTGDKGFFFSSDYFCDTGKELVDGHLLPCHYLNRIGSTRTFNPNFPMVDITADPSLKEFKKVVEDCGMTAEAYPTFCLYEDIVSLTLDNSELWFYHSIVADHNSGILDLVREAIKPCE